MPIRMDIPVVNISQDDFHSIDREIMELVFSTQNDLGRFCDEEIYQKELASRCLEMGIESVATEVPIYVSYNNFIKTYFMDLLINNSVMYELKAAETLSDQHRKQALNYLLLTGMNYGKLINMRTQSVQHEYVSTNLTSTRRHDYTIYDSEWQDLDKDSVWLKHLMSGLLSDWGAFLDTNLFYDAIMYFRGGEQNIVKRIDITSGTRLLGEQKAWLLNPCTAFKISAATRNVSYYERDMRRFLNHTQLKAIQWINLNHHKIEFKTILNRNIT